MQALPSISISGNFPVIFLPLVTILMASAIKDYYEDNKRKKSDREENLQKVLTYENGGFVEKNWKQIRVGNIIKVNNIIKNLSKNNIFQVFQDQYIPADLILLSSNGSNGICYVETKNLDGETNLKIKHVHTELRSIFESEDVCLILNSNSL